jgi:hypothetical protein
MRKPLLDRELEASIKDVISQKYVTKLKKDKFISEIKTGLGNDIKKNPRGVKIIKKTFFDRVKGFLRNLFTRF